MITKQLLKVAFFINFTVEDCKEILENITVNDIIVSPYLIKDLKVGGWMFPITI